MLLGSSGLGLLVGLGLLASDSHARATAVYEPDTSCIHASSSTISTESWSTSTAARVTPTPISTVWSDANIAAGEPFLLEIQRVNTPSLDRRQQILSQPSWLLENGNTTTNASQAAVCFIDGDGHLHINSYLMSVNDGVPSTPFAANRGPFAINTRFFTSNTMLNWTNSAFSNGTAQFYKLPADLVDNAQILGKYIGPPEPNRGWSPIIFWARSLNTPNGSPVSFSSVNASVPAPTRTATSSVIMPIPSNVSPNGRCGSLNGGYTCQGSSFGICCGSDGRCSSKNEVCQAGCQPGFGFCAPAGANISTDGFCGIQHHQTCLGSPFGHCCSMYGHCGYTEEFCDASVCVVGFGYCNTNATSSATPVLSSETALTFVTIGRSGNSTSPTDSAIGSSAIIPSSSNTTDLSSTSSILVVTSVSASSAVSSSVETTEIVSIVMVTPVPSVSSSSTSSAYPPDTCGSDYGDQRCTEANSGTCCSQLGFCGTGPEYCGLGCQTAFGDCLSMASSIASISTTSSTQ